MSQVKDAYGNVLEADPSKLNKNQIKSILTQNGISLPGSDKDKSFYEKLYLEKLYNPAKSGKLQASQKGATDGKPLKSNMDCAGFLFVTFCLIGWFLSWSVLGCFLWQSEMSAPDSCYNLAWPYIQPAMPVIQPVIDVYNTGVTKLVAMLPQ
eukprot:TRINITY_DN13295_c0_g1_i1.p1 TRINITY_DN13295_c0_g1~~TRINITY_DN13295_c0_g1_i1.p1  ORF type:complete len:159 (+),score=38.06 TRINITY_DN13295_c0_g1_i1:22-477(+)